MFFLMMNISSSSVTERLDPEPTANNGPCACPSSFVINRPTLNPEPNDNNDLYAGPSSTIMSTSTKQEKLTTTATPQTLE